LGNPKEAQRKWHVSNEGQFRIPNTKSNFKDLQTDISVGCRNMKVA